MRSTGRVIAALARLNMIDACEDLLTRTEAGDSVLREEIALSPEVASAIVATRSERLFARYVGILTMIMIPPPGISGFSTETWAEQVNPLHIERLTKFLGIIRLNSEKFRDVLIHVICNLYATGVFIPDDKLFQREVSAYLNATATAGNYLFHRLLLRTLPVYYNEVGATGMLRDDTTEIDSWGNDTAHLPQRHLGSAVQKFKSQGWLPRHQLPQMRQDPPAQDRLSVRARLASFSFG